MIGISKQKNKKQGSLMKGTIIILAMVFGLMFGVLGVGYVLSLLLPLTIFELSVLILFSGILLGVVFIAGALEEVRRDSSWMSVNEEEDDWECEECRDARLKESIENAKTRRNDPCSCGSGKKYKHCCMKYAA